MKLEVVGHFIFLTLYLDAARSAPCQYSTDLSGGKIFCSAIEKGDYISSVLDFFPQIEDTLKQNVNAEFAIEIVNSNISEVDEWVYLPWTITGDFKAKVTSFSLVNSALKSIQENSISNFKLKRLDISYNRISNYTFLSSVTDSLQFLNVSNSEISDISDILSKTQYHSTADFQFYIDASKSKVAGKVGLYSSYYFDFIDLSYNDITNLSTGKSDSSLNLEGNKNLINISPQPGYYTFSSLTLSSVDTNLLEQLQGSVTETFIVKGVNVGKLTFDSYHVFDVFASSNPTQNHFLNLSNVNITEIDDSYFEACNLALLNLSSNNIAVLKNSIFLESNIVTLDLSKSNIESIDNTVFINASIQNLILSGNMINSLKGVFAQIRNIIDLDLSNNPLESISKDTFEGCVNLKSVNLSNSIISTIGDDTFASLQFLRYLEVSFSGSFSPKSIRNTLLQQLVIRNSQISQLNDGNFEGFHGLVELSFPGSVISNVSSTAFRGLKNVRLIDYFQFNLDIDFTVLSSLIYLDLSNQNISSIESNAFKGMHHLTYINLSNNVLTTLDKDIFIDLERLEVLSLANNQFQSKALDVGIFRNLKSLTYLYANNNAILSFALGTFSALQNLQVLDLSFTNLGNHPLYELVQTLTKLKTLNLENAGLHDDGLSLSDFKLISTHLSLEKIDVSYNQWIYSDQLSKVLDVFRDNSIDFSPARPEYSQLNLYGITCVLYEDKEL